MKLSEDLRKWRAERPDEWIMDRFIESAKNLEQKCGWIPVSERLPGVEEIVLVDRRYFSTTALHIGDGIFLKDGPSRIRANHWMPLPQPVRKMKGAKANAN